MYCVLWLLLPSTVLCYAKHQLFGCEGSTLELSCPAGTTISVIRANYGRFSTSVCPGSVISTTNTVCIHPTTLRHIQSLCDAKSSCAVLVSSSQLGQHCPYTEKYLQLLYTCRQETVATHTQDHITPLWLLYMEKLDTALSQSTTTTTTIITTTTQESVPKMEFLRYLGRIKQKIYKENVVSFVNRKQRPEVTEVSSEQYSLGSDNILIIISVILCTILLLSSIILAIRVRNNRGQNMKNYLQSQDRSAYSQYIIDNTPSSWGVNNTLSITEDITRRREEEKQNRKLSYMFV